MAVWAGQSGLILFAALEERAGYSTVFTVGLVAYHLCVTVQIILESNVQVAIICIISQANTHFWVTVMYGGCCYIQSFSPVSDSSCGWQQLHKRLPSFSGGLHCEGGQSGGLHQQSVGYCLWWLLGDSWCWCGVQTAWIYLLWLERFHMYYSHVLVCISMC